jgi:MFS family permease
MSGDVTRAERAFFRSPTKLTPMPPQGDSESSVEVDAAPAAKAEPLTSRQAFLQVFPGVMVAMFLAAADQTILASALPTIAGSLGGLADLSWVVIAYLLAATIAAPLYGHLGDRFGRRRMLLGALAIFTAASLACALAPTLLLLIAARAVQGLGGGGLMTLAQALIGEHVSPRERGRFSGYFATVFALASTSGPVLGAYLTEHLSWRAVFAVNLPLGWSPPSWHGAFRRRKSSDKAAFTPTLPARCCSRCPRSRCCSRCRREETGSTGGRGRWRRLREAP